MIQKNQQKAPYSNLAPNPTHILTFFPHSFPVFLNRSIFRQLGEATTSGVASSCISDENPRNDKKANFYSLEGFHVASAWKK